MFPLFEDFWRGERLSQPNEMRRDDCLYFVENAIANSGAIAFNSGLFDVILVAVVRAHVR